MNTSACKVHGNQAEGLTHNKVNILCIRMSLELERKLVKVPYPDLRLVRPSRDRMVPVPSSFHFVTCFGEIKVLYELYRSLDLFPSCPLPFAFCGSFLR